MIINYKYAKKRINTIFKQFNLTKDMASLLRSMNISYVTINEEADWEFNLHLSVVTKSPKGTFAIFDFKVDYRLLIMDVSSEWIVTGTESKFSGKRSYIYLRYIPKSSIAAHDAIFKYHQN